MFCIQFTKHPYFSSYLEFPLFPTWVPGKQNYCTAPSANSGCAGSLEPFLIGEHILHVLGEGELQSRPHTSYHRRAQAKCVWCSFPPSANAYSEGAQCNWPQTGCEATRAAWTPALPRAHAGLSPWTVTHLSEQCLSPLGTAVSVQGAVMLGEGVQGCVRTGPDTASTQERWRHDGSLTCPYTL